MKTNTLPTAVAYFMVRVPYRKVTVEHAPDAQRVVENYLYGGGSVIDVDLDVSDFEHPVYTVAVRFETYGSAGDLSYRVNNQRDRLASGLYSSTEPTFLS